VKVKRLMTVPIFEDTQIVAAVGLANKKNKYDDNDVYQITALMSGIWNMIERAKYREELEVARNKYLSTLVSIGDAVIVIGLDEKIEMINKVCAQLTGWSEEEAKGVNYKEVFKLSHENSSIDIIDPVLKVLKTGIGHELDSHAVLTSKRNEMFIIEDSAAPIKNMQNEMIGVVLVFRDVTQKQRQIKRIKYLSFHDVLTGLYNRRLFEEAMIRLDSANNYPLTIILADLNGLKLTNDAFGHYEGDKLLKETADIIRLNIRENHIAARWGGDEFAILMPKTTSEEAKNIIKILNDKIDKKNDKKDKVILSVAFGWETKVDRSTSLNNIFKIAEEYMYKRKISESQSVRGLTIKTIIYTLFEKSPRERRHSQNVQEMATKIAKAMKLSQNKVDDISTLAYFHDIGKITVSSEILEKKERLTLAEYEEIKKHPSVGYRMMTAINEFSNIAQGVLSHHERWDGKGYPNGLKENEIPLEARIIAIADAYDAMTEARFNKAKLSKEDAIIEMKKGSNTKFDPHIVKVFIEEVLMSKKSS